MKCSSLFAGCALVVLALVANDSSAEAQQSSLNVLGASVSLPVSSSPLAQQYAAVSIIQATSAVASSELRPSEEQREKEERQRRRQEIRKLYLKLFMVMGAQ